MQKNKACGGCDWKILKKKKPAEPKAEDIPDDLDEAFSPEKMGTQRKRRKSPVETASGGGGQKGIAKALWKFIKRMVKGILPGHLIIKGTFGTGDPVWTGYLLAMAGILKGKFGEDLEIKGDFAKATAENIVVRVKGKIVPGYLLYSTLALHWRSLYAV